MAPAHNDGPKKSGQSPQKSSDQGAEMQRHLRELTAEVNRLQKEVTQSRSRGGAAADVAAGKLKEAQTKLQGLQKQISEMQAGAQPPKGPVQQPPARGSGGLADAAAALGGRDLVIGGSAWVAQAGGLPLRLRSRPGLAPDTVIDRLPPGTQMTLLEGPRQADNHAWWRIRTADGREGWVAGEDLRARPE